MGWNGNPVCQNAPEIKLLLFLKRIQFLELKEISTGKLAKGGCITSHSQFIKDTSDEHNKSIIYNEHYRLL